VFRAFGTASRELQRARTPARLSEGAKLNAKTVRIVAAAAVLVVAIVLLIVLKKDDGGEDKPSDAGKFPTINSWASSSIHAGGPPLTPP